MSEHGTGATAGVAGRGADMLLSIQILRAVAALGVLTHHVMNDVATGIGRPGFLNELAVGAGGVDLFFVISGFVMVYASQSLFGRADGPRIFVLRRLARIVPLYWAVTAAFLAYVLYAHNGLPPGLMSVEGVIASFVFLPYPRLDGLMVPAHALGWTLNHEMFFYAVFAAAVLLSRRQAVLAVATAFVVLVVAGRLFALPQPFAFWFSPIILEFCFGMLIAAAYREGVRFSRAMSWGAVLVALAAFGVSALFEPNVDWRALIWGVPGALLVAGLVLSKDTPRPGRVARAFAFIGDTSYSLYLVHALTFLIPRRIFAPWMDVPLVPVAYVLTLFAVSIAAGIVSYLLFERPVTRALQKWIGRMRVQPSEEKSTIGREGEDYRAIGRGPAKS